MGARVKELASMDVILVVVTLGSNGCNYYAKNESGHVDGYTVNAVDATEAGDLCYGSFILQFI